MRTEKPWDGGADLLEICQIDEEISVAAIVTALRTNVPVVLEHLGVK
jgi:hypothetical protein